MKILAAPWVVPVIGPPRQRGAVLVKGGTILAVGDPDEFRAVAPHAVFEEFVDCALTPSLINCHTHLELTDLGNLDGGGDFVGWLKGVIALKTGASPEDFARSAAKGCAKCLEHGQSVVADVVSTVGASGHTTGGRPIRLRLAEVISASDEGASGAVERALDLLGEEGDPAWGLFPHTPYTVGDEGYRISAQASVARWGRFFTHLAESGEEVEYCLTGRGSVADRLYQGLPVRPPKPPMLHPVDHLEHLGLLNKSAVLVHAVQVGPREVEKIARSGAGVVLCPRSNRALGVGDAPGRQLLDAGVHLGLGTDSALSAGDLDLWKEMLVAVDAYGLAPLEALEAATLWGAALLGLAPGRGALYAGSRADILAVRLGEGGTLSEKLATSPGLRAFILGGERVN